MKCNLAELLIHCTRANKLEIHPKTLSTRIQIFLKMDIFSSFQSPASTLNDVFEHQELTIRNRVECARKRLLVDFMWSGRTKSGVLECDDAIHLTGHVLQGMLSYFHRFGVSCGRPGENVSFLYLLLANPFHFWSSPIDRLSLKQLFQKHLQLTKKNKAVLTVR